MCKANKASKEAIQTIKDSQDIETPQEDYERIFEEYQAAIIKIEKLTAELNKVNKSIKTNKSNIEPITIGISDLEKITGLSRNICYKLGEQAGAVVVIPGIDRKLFSYPIIKEYLEKHLLINQEKETSHGE